MPDGSLEERAALLAVALGTTDSGACFPLAHAARFERLADGAELPARTAWLVLEGDVRDGSGRAVAAGGLAGWRTVLSERIRPERARAHGVASVLVLDGAAVREALLLDFDLLLAVARPLATPPPAPSRAAPPPTIIERLARLRAIEPFRRFTLDALLEVAAQGLAPPLAEAALARALGGGGLGADEDAILDVLEDHPRCALAIVEWLAERGDSG